MGKKLKRPKRVEDTAEAGGDISSIQDIFAELKASKASSPKADSDKKLQVEESVPLGKKRPRSPNDEMQSTNSASTENVGLYRAPSPTVEMNDDDFFGNARKHRGATSSTKKRGADQGLTKVMTEKEVLKYTGRGGAKAGTTPNCPFDCDCCF